MLSTVDRLNGRLPIHRRERGSAAERPMPSKPSMGKIKICQDISQSSFMCCESDSVSNRARQVRLSPRLPTFEHHRFAPMGQLSTSERHGSTPSTNAPRSHLVATDFLWKTTHHFRRMLQTRALTAYVDALKNVDMTDLGGSMFLRLPENTMGGETP